MTATEQHEGPRRNDWVALILEGRPQWFRVQSTWTEQATNDGSPPRGPMVVVYHGGGAYSHPVSDLLAWAPSYPELMARLERETRP